MPELICHLIGDYVLQNHAMATRKTSSWVWAAIHVAFYMIPFLILTRSPLALGIMAGTHLVIDRFRLAKYWVGFWGVGCEGSLPRWLTIARWHESGRIADRPISPAPAPDFLAIWLLIIADNTAHLAINHLSLVYLGGA